MQICESIVNASYAKISIKRFTHNFFTLELKKEALPRFSSQFYDENFEKKLKLMRKSAIDVLGSMRI